MLQVFTTFSQVWQYFITRNEQEQQDYLESVSPKTHHRNNGKGLSGFSFTQINSETLEENLPGAEGMYYFISVCVYVYSHSSWCRFTVMLF